MKNRLVFKLLITLLFGLVLYYFMLPPINLHAGAFYTFIIIILLFYFIISISEKFKVSNNYLDVRNNFNLSKDLKYIFFGIVGVLGLIILVNLVLSPLFNSKAYYKRITVSEDKNFTEDIKEVDFNHIPLLDKESSQKLGDRVMGQMTDLVSQFSVSSLYTQINYKNDIVRVTPLEYVDFIKYFVNRKEGIPAYITVNSVSGKAELTRLKKGMRYMPSSLFFENLNRKLRIEYPTTIFDTANFEIDNDGNPYWIVPTIKYVGVGVRKEVSGAIIFNPITGESKKYKVEDVPTWVDHVYNSNLIIEQVNDWGAYKNGFLYTIFG